VNANGARYVPRIDVIDGRPRQAAVAVAGLMRSESGLCSAAPALPSHSARSPEPRSELLEIQQW
jgi:hypothetical protein